MVTSTAWWRPRRNASWAALTVSLTSTSGSIEGRSEHDTSSTARLSPAGSNPTGGEIGVSVQRDAGEHALQQSGDGRPQAVHSVDQLVGGTSSATVASPGPAAAAANRRITCASSSAGGDG